MSITLIVFLILFLECYLFRISFFNSFWIFSYLDLLSRFQGGFNPIISKTNFTRLSRYLRSLPWRCKGDTMDVSFLGVIC